MLIFKYDKIMKLFYIINSFIRKVYDKLLGLHYLGFFGGLVLLLYLDSLICHSNTLFPVCIPWMLFFIAIGIISLITACLKKYILNAKIIFFDYLGACFLKLYLIFILFSALIILPNRYFSIAEESECQSGIILDVTTVPISKSPTVKRYYCKVKLDDEDTSFWYDLGKETKTVGTKCDLTIKRGLLGLRFVEKVDFPVK